MSDAAYPTHPRPAVAAVVFHAGKVLLVHRARPPRQGRWALPGGSVHLGETMQQAAEREVAEETGITVCAGDPVNTFDVIVRDEDGAVRFHYVVVDLTADYVAGRPVGNEEVHEAGWFDPRALDGLDMDRDTLALIRRLAGIAPPAADPDIDL